MTESPATAPTQREINAEQDPTRRAVLAAMDRMLRGTPTITRPGLLSKAGLAREAQVDRNRITQGSCRDLGDRFAALVEQRRAPTTALEVQQQARIDTLLDELRSLTDAHTALVRDRDHWKASTHTLLRAIQVLRLEQTSMQATIRVLNKRLEAAHDPGTSGLYVVPGDRTRP
jgi:hypothetical protein